MSLSIASTIRKWVDQRLDVTLSHCSLSNLQDLFKWSEPLEQNTFDSGWVTDGSFVYTCFYMGHKWSIIYWTYCETKLPTSHQSRGSMIAIQGNVEDLSRAFLFYKIKPPLGEISWALESFRCCPWFFQRFKYIGCPWGPTNRYTPGSYFWQHLPHHPFWNIVMISQGPHPLLPPSLFLTTHCSLPHSYYPHKGWTPNPDITNNLLKWTWYSNQRNQPGTDAFVTIVTCINQIVIHFQRGTHLESTVL